LEFGRVGGIITGDRVRGGSMIGKKNVGRSYGACLATIYATLIIGTVYELSGGLHIILALLIFVVLWIGFYLAGVWAAVERPAELNRKFPISSKEVRRRRKAFRDWLASQGRR
jgi:hypothetical protein